MHIEPESYVDELRVTVLAEDTVGQDSPCLGQHGLCLLLETFRDGLLSRIIMDTGQNGDAILYNMKKLGIEPQNTDIIFITHCHYDHTGGLIPILKALNGVDVPIVIHPTFDRNHFETRPKLQYIGIPSGGDRSSIYEAGGRLIEASGPMEIAMGVWSSGEIPRVTSFETHNKNLMTIDDSASAIQDIMRDDMSIYIYIKNFGVVVVTGCSHAGIVNISLRAKDIMGATPRVIIGGLHLVHANDERIESTIEELKAMGVERLFIGHCTGFEAMCRIFAAYGKELTPLRSGMNFRINP